MKYAVYSPGFGAFSDPRVLARLASIAEEAGWDGFFLWDHILFGIPSSPADRNGTPCAPIGDPWVTLSAMAACTSRIKLGTVITPLPRRRPWKLARECVTLDYLSGGRLILGVGLGSDQFGREYSAFGEPADDLTHAQMLDEGLEVIAGLWSGEPFSYHGQHYHVDNVTFLPKPLQEPRIPIWVAATWPNKRPFRRSARLSGVIPASHHERLFPSEYREMAGYIRQFRPVDEPFDMIRPANLPAGAPEQVIEMVSEFEEAGVTWWLVPVEDDMGSIEQIEAVIQQGPPPAQMAGY